MRDHTTTDMPVGPATVSAAVEAIQRWTAVLGCSKDVAEAADLRPFEENEIGSQRSVIAVLRPVSTGEVAEIVKIANECQVPLYPVSTGKNWGYGGASPVQSGCAIVDLSRMRRIVDFDDELGLVTVEPGVIQQQLYEFLLEKGASYLVPVTGAGPHCSLLANALERGYGVTPIADHFAAITQLEAVLPDGTVYRSALDDLNGRSVNRAHKWGLGPYLDGLFTQSNLGIVTCATIALAPNPERIEAFLVSLKSEASLEPAVEAVREILKSSSGASGSINIMNGRRMLAMMEGYPSHMVGTDGVVTDEAVAERLNQNSLTEWTVGGMIHGDRAQVRSFRRQIKRLLGPSATRVVFLNRKRIDFGRRLAGFLPGGWGKALQARLSRLSEMFKAAEGIPTEAALPLCYWKSGRKPTAGAEMNPAIDGCGIIWYSPLVTMKSADVHSYVSMVDTVCRHHRMEPLITLTSLSARCFDSTVPLLFDPSDAKETARAKACYDELFEEGRKMGFVPYRVGIDQMHKVVDSDSPFWQTVGKIKQALDPHNIIAPGRYCPDDDL